MSESLIWRLFQLHEILISTSNFFVSAISLLSPKSHYEHYRILFARAEISIGFYLQNIYAYRIVEIGKEGVICFTSNYLWPDKLLLSQRARFGLSGNASGSLARDEWQRGTRWAESRAR